METPKIPFFLPGSFEQHEVKQLVEKEQIRVFQVYLPFSSGERIHLADLYFPFTADPRGTDVLSLLFEKEDLEDEVESLEHDAPCTTPEQFWEAYDACRVDPYQLKWEVLSKEAALFAFSMPPAPGADLMADLYREAIDKSCSKED